MKVKRLFIPALVVPALLCVATAAHAAGTVALFSAGVGHVSVAGVEANEAELSAQAKTDNVLYGAEIAGGSGTRRLSLTGGYELSLTPGLSVAPEVKAGYTRAAGSAQKHVAFGASASYTLTSRLTVLASAYAGHAFGASGVYTNGGYMSAAAGVAYPVGAGFVLVHYDWSRSPGAMGGHVLSRGVSIDYAIEF